MGKEKNNKSPFTKILFNLIGSQTFYLHTHRHTRTHTNIQIHTHRYPHTHTHTHRYPHTQIPRMCP